LRALVERYTTTPTLLPAGENLDAGSDAARFAAVSYVAGMTDRFACRQGMAVLGWDASRLPRGIDV
jgi:dGTPase